MRLPASRFPLLPRKKNTDKTHYGHTLIIAGSRGMAGAAVLSARAALMSGSGLVTLAVPKSLGSRITIAIPEAMTLELPETATGSMAGSALTKLKDFITKKKIQSILIGPGLSIHPETSKLVCRLVAFSATPVVLDADGLNAFKGQSKLLRAHKAPLVLTPHRKEFERLFNESWPQNRDTRIALVKKLSKFYRMTLVLKGSRTLVIANDQVFINTTGNPAMAKGGSGDVLSGMIAAFLAQGLDSFQASRWAVYFHGKAGDRAACEKGELSVLASDIIKQLPKVFRRA